MIVKLKNGESYVGLLNNEDAENVYLNSPEDGLLRIPKESIQSLDLGLSAMLPEIADMLTVRELRDLVEFLARQK